MICMSASRYDADRVRGPCPDAQCIQQSNRFGLPVGWITDHCRRVRPTRRLSDCRRRGGARRATFVAFTCRRVDRGSISTEIGAASNGPFPRNLAAPMTPTAEQVSGPGAQAPSDDSGAWCYASGQRIATRFPNGAPTAKTPNPCAFSIFRNGRRVNSCST